MMKKPLILFAAMIVGFVAFAQTPSRLPPLPKTDDPTEAKTMPPLPVPEEYNAPVNLEAVKTPPQTIEFEGSTYTLLKDDELKSTISNTEISHEIGGEIFGPNGGYARWGGIARFVGKYKIENSKLCVSTYKGEQCSRAFYKNKSGELIGINLFLRDGDKKPGRANLKPRKE